VSLATSFGQHTAVYNSYPALCVLFSCCFESRMLLSLVVIGVCYRRQFVMQTRD